MMMIAGLGGQLLGGIGEKEQIKAQAKAEQEEFRRRQEEENRAAAADASDRALAAAKATAEGIAAMESIGGFGSVNDERLEMEIAGTAGLDLARIESNRQARNAVHRAGAKAARAAAAAQSRAVDSKFLQSAFSTGAGVMKNEAAVGFRKYLEDEELNK